MPIAVLRIIGGENDANGSSLGDGGLEAFSTKRVPAAFSRGGSPDEWGPRLLAGRFNAVNSVILVASGLNIDFQWAKKAFAPSAVQRRSLNC